MGRATIVTRAGCRGMENIQHPTSNIQRPTKTLRSRTRRPSGCSMLVVGCWMFLLLLSFGANSTNAADQFPNADCLDCHTDPTNSRKVDGKTVPLALFPTNTF